MSADDDLNVTQWAAVIVLLLVLLVPVATALAAWARQRYTRAVTQWQAALADEAAPAAPGTPSPAVPSAAVACPSPAGLSADPARPSPAVPLHIDLRPARDVTPDAGADPARPARWLRRRVLAVQFVAGLLYWWVLLLCAAAALWHFDAVTAGDAGRSGAGGPPGARAGAPPAPGAMTAPGGAGTLMLAVAGGSGAPSAGGAVRVGSAVAAVPAPAAPSDRSVALGAQEDRTGAAVEAGSGVAALAAQLVLWPLLVLPALLGWAFQAGLPERRVWLACALAALFFGAGLVGSGAGWLAAAGSALVALLLAALLAAFLRPAVRGAGPPMVAALTVGLLVFCLLVLAIAAFDDGSDEAVTTLDWTLAIGLLLGLLAVSAWVAWRVLLRLARRYAEKRFSEMQLALGAYWGLATALTCGLVLLLSFEERTGASMQWVALAVGLAWGAWRLLQRLALWLARRGAPPPLGALLMLRVFKPSNRSEAFTDRFLARWRFAGPVWMIAGPDLAGAYMEPDEFFAFLGGRLKDRFIAREDEVPSRVQALDDVRDPDGRFRVNELFCSNSTWQAAVRALIDRAGVVLLDLREFTPARAGTRYELEQLLQRVPLHRVVVVVDARADDAPVRAAIDAAWQRVGASACHAGAAPTLTLLTLAGDHGGDLRGLVAAVARAAQPSP